MQVTIRKGKNIPIKGNYKEEIIESISSQKVALNFSCFSSIRLQLIKKVDEKVKIGEIVACDRKFPERVYVSPVSGKIVDIERGEKRKILNIVIENDHQNNYFEYPQLDIQKTNKEELLSLWQKCGILSKVHVRPTDTYVKPKELPKSIFIKASDTAPLAPHPKHEAKKYEKEFLSGIEALKRLEIPIHLVTDEKGSFFKEINGVNLHTIKGPHPSGNLSTAIFYIDPITGLSDQRWAMTVHDVVSIGMVTTTGKIHHHKIISLAGEGIQESKRCLYHVLEGVSISEIAEINQDYRVISGDPLTGLEIGPKGYLGFEDFSICAIPNLTKHRQFLHFFRLGWNKFSISNSYLSRLNAYKNGVSLDTNQHGEIRAFVDTEIYDKVFPLRLPVILIIKALIAKDYEKAMDLGVLEVVSEDFALPTFICPSKIDMISIVKQGLNEIAEQYM